MPINAIFFSEKMLNDEFFNITRPTITARTMPQQPGEGKLLEGVDFCCTFAADLWDERRFSSSSSLP